MVDGKLQTDESSLRWRVTSGMDDFISHLPPLSGRAKADTARLIGWAATLPDVELRSSTAERAAYPRLYPVARRHRESLLRIDAHSSGPRVHVNRRTLELYAHKSIGAVERAVAPVELGRDTIVLNITPDLLDAFAEAYREASQDEISPTLARERENVDRWTDTSGMIVYDKFGNVKQWAGNRTTPPTEDERGRMDRYVRAWRMWSSSGDGSGLRSIGLDVDDRDWESGERTTPESADTERLTDEAG